MKKYKVITDNLDWCGLEKNDIIKYQSYRCSNSNESFYTKKEKVENKLMTDKIIFEKEEFDLLIKQHPEWFEEIKEEDIIKNLFTKGDMIEFANYCCRYDGVFEGGISTAHNLFNEWLKSKNK